jgi:hypothetical protein
MRAQPVVPMMLALVLDDLCCELGDSLSQADQDEEYRCCFASNSAIYAFVLLLRSPSNQLVQLLSSLVEKSVDRNLPQSRNSLH